VRPQPEAAQTWGTWCVLDQPDRDHRSSALAPSSQRTVAMVH
jgi:hypothetical protein